MTGLSSAPALPAVVVDTDIVSYLFKGDTRAALYQPHVVGRYRVISFMTVAELARWAEERNWGARTRDQLKRFLAGFAVHYPDEAMCESWGSVMAAARRAGRPIQSADAWIAATALLYGAALVTNNASDCAGVPGLLVVSEASP
jgi:predicted nucleic acid-binding protein